MRTIEFETIAEAVADAAVDAARVLPDDVLSAIKGARDRERLPLAKEILGQLLDNARVAREESVPLCQDCGLAVCFVRIGSGVTVTGAGIGEAINEGVRRGCERGYLRKSVVADPFKRVNTGDNTPAIIHSDMVEGDDLSIGFMAKGGGCENMSRVALLTPGQGRAGVINFVVEAVRSAGGNPCPPTIVGVGIGGTFEKAAILAKQSLLRRLDEPNPQKDLAALEDEILGRVNALGIGPQGLGGDTTALGVHVEVFPCHIASLPVAVNIECHSHRTRRIVL